MEKKINLEIFKEQQRLITEEPSFSPSVKPFQNVLSPFQSIFETKGNELISEGKVGCILVAGGEGTRLEFDGPKGCFPLTAVKHKTLFQIIAEKLHAASLQHNRLLKMAIMTSSKNRAAIQSHFITHDFFGCSPHQIAFFQQGELPFLTTSGDLVRQDGQIAFGPDGNGSSIAAFMDSPIAKHWEQEGIHYANFILIDNPIADPFDPFLIGAHSINAAEVTIKCMERDDPDEKLGLIVDILGKPGVIEYMEAPKEIWEKRTPEGTLSYAIANISLFCFSLSFLANAAKHPLPLHKALKNGVWKFERFIFDILPFAKTAQALIYPRRICFAPVKNKEGKNSPETARHALSLRDREVLEAVAGKKVPNACLEIDPQFYYPTEILLNKWKGKEIPNIPYVES